MAARPGGRRRGTRGTYLQTVPAPSAGTIGTSHGRGCTHAQHRIDEPVGCRVAGQPPRLEVAVERPRPLDAALGRPLKPGVHPLDPARARHQPDRTDTSVVHAAGTRGPVRSEAAASLPTLLADFATWIDIDTIAWGRRYAVTMACRILYTLNIAEVREQAGRAGVGALDSPAALAAVTGTGPRRARSGLGPAPSAPGRRG